MLITDIFICYQLAYFVRALADDNVIDFWFLAKFSKILFCDIGHELVMNFILNQVDGAATEAATHDTTACNTVLFGNIIEEIQLFARYLIVLAQAFMGFVHLLTHRFIVAGFQCIANGQHTVFLTQYEAGAVVIFLTNFGFHGF